MLQNQEKTITVTSIYLYMCMWENVGSAICVKWNCTCKPQNERDFYWTCVLFGFKLKSSNAKFPLTKKTPWETKTLQCIQVSMVNFNQSKYFVIDTKILNLNANVYLHRVSPRKCKHIVFFVHGSYPWKTDSTCQWYNFTEFKQQCWSANLPVKF